MGTGATVVIFCFKRLSKVRQQSTSQNGVENTEDGPGIILRHVSSSEPEFVYVNPDELSTATDYEVIHDYADPDEDDGYLQVF